MDLSAIKDRLKEADIDTIRVDYFRDRDVAFEAFFAGAYDFREERGPFIGIGEFLEDAAPGEGASTGGHVDMGSNSSRKNAINRIE